MTVEPETCQRYGLDWTKFEVPNPCGVAFPRATDEVAQLLAACGELQLAVVPSGGRTGLSGGAVASEGELVLSFERLQKLETVDEFGMTVRVEAGVVTQNVHRHTAPLGLTWPVDLAAKGSCTVGGNLATNAGGLKVIRYGHTRHWVSGLQAVTITGDVLQLGGSVLKNNTGPDLAQVLIGSEGILAVITEGTLRLTPLPPQTSTALFGLQGPELALELLRSARAAGLTLQAFEFFTPDCLEVVTTVSGCDSPFSQTYRGYALVECESPVSQVQKWAVTQLEKGVVQDGVVAANSKESRKLWALRERITESLGATGLMHKNDVAVPVAAIPEFFRRFQAEVSPAYPGKCYLFGHLGDGNIHVNVMKPSSMSPEQFLNLARQVDLQLYALLQQLQGSIAAEHGIGKLKVGALGYSRSAAVVSQMIQLKRSFDPQWLLNPGKVLPRSVVGSVGQSKPSESPANPDSGS